jgi:hypothetical protein
LRSSTLQHDDRRDGAVASGRRSAYCPGIRDLSREGARVRAAYRTDRGDEQSLGAHRPKKIGRPIEQRGYELPYLPAYSPDYNPIEEAAFAKIKKLPRKAAARSREALVEAVGAALSTITAEDAWASWNIPATVRRVSYCERRAVPLGDHR